MEEIVIQMDVSSPHLTDSRAGAGPGPERPSAEPSPPRLLAEARLLHAGGGLHAPGLLERRAGRAQVQLRGQSKCQPRSPSRSP